MVFRRDLIHEYVYYGKVFHSREVVYRAKILLNAEKGGGLRRGGMWSVYIRLVRWSEVWVLVKWV